MHALAFTPEVEAPVVLEVLVRPHRSQFEDCLCTLGAPAGAGYPTCPARGRLSQRLRAIRAASREDGQEGQRPPGRLIAGSRQLRRCRAGRVATAFSSVLGHAQTAVPLGEPHPFHSEQEYSSRPSCYRAYPYPTKRCGRRPQSAPGRKRASTGRVIFVLMRVAPATHSACARRQRSITPQGKPVPLCATFRPPAPVQIAFCPKVENRGSNPVTSTPRRHVSAGSIAKPHDRGSPLFGRAHSVVSGGPAGQAKSSSRPGQTAV